MSEKTGVKSAAIQAWSRIGELAEAIERQARSAAGNAKAVNGWAAEIRLQTKIIQMFENGEAE